MSLLGQLHDSLNAIRRRPPEPEECANCHGKTFAIMADGQRRCPCGLRWRNRDVVQLAQPVQLKFTA